VFFDRGQYSAFKEKLYLFDDRIDCVAFGRWMFIKNKSHFHNIFKFYEMLVKTAEETLKTIKRYIPIDGFDEFAEACKGHFQKLAKLKNIAGKSYLQRIRIKDLKEVASKCHLPIKFIGSGTSAKIRYDASNKWAILKLLDDDYLQSLMTKERYEVNSKRPLPSPLR